MDDIAIERERKKRLRDVVDDLIYDLDYLEGDD